MDEVYVARQPIFDRKQHVTGYELLFPEGQADSAAGVDCAAATASVVLNSLTEIGLRRIVGVQPPWIKVSREFVSEGLVELLPRRAVLELVKDQAPDQELIAEVAELKRAGHMIALDGIRDTPETDELLRVVDFVKLDLVELGREQFAREVARVKRYGVTLLAARVEKPAGPRFLQAGWMRAVPGLLLLPAAAHVRHANRREPAGRARAPRRDDHRFGARTLL